MIEPISEIEVHRQTEHILSLPIWISWAAFLVALISAVFTSDWGLASATLIGIVFLIIPFWLLKRGYFLLSGSIYVLMMLITVTAIAAIGQGIHDVAIMAYPIVIFFSSLALNRLGFRISVGLTLIAMGWLVFGESWGLFVSAPYKTPTWVDFLVISSILLSAAAAVDILATNMRKNLAQAKQEIAQRKEMEELLRYQSSHDSMTGIYNRNFFETELHRLDLSREFPISIIIADVDGLKIVNDTLGHAAGDEKLRQASEVLRSTFRAGDIFARIGGDEFAALLPETDAATAQQIVSRIKVRLLDHNARNPTLPLQLSLGAATAADNLTDAFTLADKRMYADKSLRKSGDTSIHTS